MTPTPDTTTETKSSVTRTSGLSLNSQEGQQIMYLSLLLLALVLLNYVPLIKEQAVWLFGAASGALFAKSKQS
jgi:hypothetical protein